MGWPQNAYVGQQIICIGKPDFEPQFNEPKPIIGNKYTISAIVLSPKGSVCFQLKEINPKFYTDMNWQYSMFRPVQSTEKGMEILRGLLNTHSDGDAKIIEEFMKRCELIP